MIAFVIPIKVTSEYSLNNMSRAGVANTRKKKGIEEATIYAMMAAGIKRRQIERPVEIKISYDSQLDIDNHGYINKAIIDALKDYLLSDDNKNHVVRLITEFWDGRDIKVEIRELDNGVPAPSKRKARRRNGVPR